MCGIIGGVTNKNITPVLINGLKKLEYRGYDSSGLSILSENGSILRARSVGKVNKLVKNLKQRQNKIIGNTGIAHTRWATHGEPLEKNAHPHISKNAVSVVHNGIIENYLDLKIRQSNQGYEFSSETDTEVIAHEIDIELKSCDSLIFATQKALKSLKGSYGLGIISSKYPNQIIAARKNSPLVIGIGKNANYIASDQMALLSETKEFIFLEDGDVAEIKMNQITIYNQNGFEVKRDIKTSNLQEGQVEKGPYKHFMLKEIFEQPQAIRDTLESRVTNNKVVASSFGFNAHKVFNRIQHVQIVACGTSYHAGIVAKYWIEDIAKVPCNIEVASEYRYRRPVLNNKTLIVTLSQSGETADTIEALKMVNKINMDIDSLCITNSSESSLARISDLVFLTHAGPEIGVASTKAFTSQLVSLALLTCAIGKIKGNINDSQETGIVLGLKKLPGLINETLLQEDQIKQIANRFKNKNSALFLGRGTMHAIALEGALKLKEISYIHAEAYPAGELKHGPIALIDKNMPVIAIAPNDELLEKLKGNLQEVKSRGSEMIVFEDHNSKVQSMDNMEIIPITANLGRITAPIIFTIPLQLLSYHVALKRGTNIDKPRNLAKSVTVE
jgi:glutamine---fructose-6-phosphate transaminase (isomerizing)